MAVTGTKWVPDLLVYGLEKKYAVFRPITTDSILTYIHVLGGGGSYDISIPGQEQLCQSSLARLNEGLRLHRQIPKSRLVFSGYSSDGSVTQAELMMDAAVALGVKKENIIILKKPTTTQEEALEYAATLGKDSARLILVTSDIHMPRAMKLFKRAGLNPVAAPSDHILKTSYVPGKNQIRLIKKHFWWESGKGNFEKFSSAMHEYIGLLWAEMF